MLQHIQNNYRTSKLRETNLRLKRGVHEYLYSRNVDLLLLLTTTTSTTSSSTTTATTTTTTTTTTVTTPRGVLLTRERFANLV